MKKPHKHAALIKAWADGAEIEYWNTFYQEWIYCFDTPSWCLSRNYRIKPEPKPDIILFKYVAPTTGTVGKGDYDYACYYPNLKLTLDGETGKLKKAEVIND